MIKKKTAAGAVRKSGPTQWERLAEQLMFSQETLLADAAAQPRLFLSAVEHRVKCLRTAMQAKMNLDGVEAEAGFRARELLTKQEEKVTEKRVEELVRTDPLRVAALEQRLAADAQEEASKLLVEAFRHRRDCLKLVAEMVSSEVSLQSAVETGRTQLEKTRQRVKERYNA